MNIAVIDLQWGDGGKGGCVDSLVRSLKSDLVVRFSGGQQASHNVVLPDGRHHGFAQWGSGTFAGVPTYLSKYMMIEPYAMRNEAHALSTKGVSDPWSMLTVDPDCLVTMPWHFELNRLLERHRGNDRHGSCGMGVGETREDDLLHGGIRVKDIGNYDAMQGSCQRAIKKAKELIGDDAVCALKKEKIEQVLRDHIAIRERMTVAHLSLMNRDNIIYEGSQGVLIDETIGFAPYHTWSDVTANKAIELSGGNCHVIGIVPCVWTRHGAGPFPTLKSEVSIKTHNTESQWQGSVRFGWVDLPLLRYVLSKTRVDSIAITQGDQVKWPMPVCESYTGANGEVYKQIVSSTADGLEFYRPNYRTVQDVWDLGKSIEKPVSLTSYGATHESKSTWRKNLPQAVPV